MGKCHFTKEWLDRTDSSGCKVSEWGRKHSDSEVFCFVCERVFSIDKGFYAIKQHSLTEKHKSNIKIKNDSKQKQLHLSTSGNDCSKSISLYNPKDSAYKAELIWCLKSVWSNFSVNSCDNIVNIFRAMFPNLVPENFSLNRTKASYLISEALAPYFRDIFLPEVQGEYFTLQYDETTNHAGKKELQTVVRFWSPSRKEIATKHLESFFLGHATAEDIKEKIFEALSNADLPLSKLLMLGSDGPNINKKVFRLVNEEVLLCRGKGLVNIGFCNIHVIHNAFQKGLEELGCDASDLVISIHAFFHNWPARWEDFSAIQKQLKVPQLHFIKHVSSRWLTLQPAAERVLQQWDAIVEYFLKFIPMKACHLMHTISSKKIVAFLKKKTIKAELYFVASSARMFTEFTGYFQREEPLIHLLYEHLKYLLMNVMSHICKSEALKSPRQLKKELLDAPNLLSPSQIILSDEVLSCLSAVTLADKNSFFLSAQKHYIAASKYILSKIQPGSAIESFRCLQPKNIKSSQFLQHMLEIASLLPLKIDNDKLKAECRLLSVENIIDMEKDSRIDHFWGEIFNMKHLNIPKYPTVSQIIKACLTFSHGSANIERGFSRSGKVLAEDRASMTAKMLNSKLTVLDGIQSYGGEPECVPITKDLLKLAHNAFNSYNLYLEKERTKKEEIIRREEAEAKEKEMQKETLQKLQESKKDIDELKKELKEAKKHEDAHLTASEKLLNEANSRLKRALDANNFVEAKLAQAMIEGLVKTKEDYKDKRKAVSLLEKEIEKKKDTVITNFFNKKPKI